MEPSLFIERGRGQRVVCEGAGVRGEDVDGAEAAEGDGAVVVEEVAAPAAAVVPTVGSDSDDARLLKPILGDEKVNVFLKLDLILLNQSAVLTLDEAEEKAEIEQSSSAS